MEQHDKQRYIAAIERLLRRGTEIPISRREIAEMIVDQVITIAIEEERDVWIRIMYSPYTRRTQ